jgi:ammonia channel protein AmtB
VLRGSGSAASHHLRRWALEDAWQYEYVLACVQSIIAIVVVALFSFTATWLIATIIQKTIGFRVYRDDELTGLDTTFHAESAYDITGNSNRY